MPEEAFTLNGQISKLPSVTLEWGWRGQWPVTQSLNCLDWINRDKLGNPISAPQLCNLKECEHKYRCPGISVALSGRLELLNCLDYGVSSLKAINIFFSPHNELQTCWRGIEKTLSGCMCMRVCIRRSNWCLPCWLSTFWLTSDVNSLKTTQRFSPHWTLFVLLCLGCLSVPKLVSMANHSVPPCDLFFNRAWHESDSQREAEEGQSQFE